MRLKNLTPHQIILVRADGSKEVLEPEGIVPRVRMTAVSAGEVLGIPVVISAPLGVEGLPDPEPGVFFIVSRAVAAAAPSREDLLVPDGLVRDEEGKVIGARRLARVR